LYEMLDPQAFRQRREEMLREAKSSRVLYLQIATGAVI
jgi:hypothetical protein